jgi:uncharacterized protein YjiS (DUF1127 family)
MNTPDCTHTIRRRRAPLVLAIALAWFALRRCGRACEGIAEIGLRWIDRGRQRRQLAELSDHMLRDIGITRADAWAEADKPFWLP